MFKNNFWIDHLEYNNDEFISTILNYLKVHGSSSIWDYCKVESSHQLDYKPQVPQDLVDLLNLRIKQFEKTELGSIFSDLKISDIWYNIYTQDMNQEVHTHEDTGFSGIYFLKFDNNLHTSPVFHNPVFYYNFHHQALRSIEKINYTPKIKQGDLIIFPGNIPHQVEKQKSNIPRITITFNIDINLQDLYTNFLKTVVG